MTTDTGKITVDYVKTIGLTSNSPSTDYLNVTELQTGDKEDLECNGKC